nr:hypothetical protein [Bradyrhizobium sp.]
MIKQLYSVEPPREIHAAQFPGRQGIQHSRSKYIGVPERAGTRYLGLLMYFPVKNLALILA